MQYSVEDQRVVCRDKHGFKIPVQSPTSCVTLEKLLNISESAFSSEGTIALLYAGYALELHKSSVNPRGMATRDDIMFFYILLQINKKSATHGYLL